MSIPEWKDLERSGIFQYVCCSDCGSVNLTGSSQPSRIQFQPVTPSYFALLGVKPELGRRFDPDDPTPGFTLEVVISDGLWKRAFGGDPQILGRSLRLDNDLYRVIGVMPAGFHDPGRTPEQRNTELWAAAGFAGEPAPPPIRSTRFTLETIARLKPGLTIAAAQSQLDALVASLQKQFPDDYPRRKCMEGAAGAAEGERGRQRSPVVDIAAGRGGLGAADRLCECGESAAGAGQRERTRDGRSPGARGRARMRLVRQLLTESLLLSLLGGMAGLAILFCTRGFLLQMVPESLPRLNDISINWSVMLFALGASVVAGTIFGLAPALQAGRLNLSQTLRLEGRGSRGSTEQTQTRHVLVVMEFALSLVLMIAAGLLLRSFWDLFKVRLGFNPQHVMAVRCGCLCPMTLRPTSMERAAQEAPFLRELLRRGRIVAGSARSGARNRRVHSIESRSKRSR